VLLSFRSIRQSLCAAAEPDFNRKPRLQLTFVTYIDNIVKHIQDYYAALLGEFEQVVLLSLVRLGNGTFGAAIRRDIFGVYVGRGYNGNVWATWLRDLRLDFGYLGAICFCGLFGGFMAWARNRFELTGAVHYHCLVTIAGLTFANGAFSNLLFNNFLAYAFFVGVAFMVAMQIDFRPQRRRKLRTALVS